MRHQYTKAELGETLRNLPAGAARLGVIGHPIEHSKSPQMQQAALDAMHESLSYIRILGGLEEGAFESLLDRLRELGFLGVNVTVPFKKNAWRAAKHRDPLAELSGAVNTLAWRADGLHGYNTDGPGFERAIAELCRGKKKLSDLRVVLLGACGGAGSALACQCALAQCPSLTLVNRPRPQLAELRDRLAPRTAGELTALTFDSPALPAALGNADLIVNATSLGLREGDPLPLVPTALHAGQFVYDIVPHDTPLRRAAEARGCVADNGLGMLLWQGAIAYFHWFGTMPPIEPMRRALLRA